MHYLGREGPQPLPRAHTAVPPGRLPPCTAECTISSPLRIAPLRRMKPQGPHLILAPKAVLSNWMSEMARWAPPLTALLYDGTKEERAALRSNVLEAGRFDVCVTHYDLAIRDKGAFKKVGRGVGAGWGGRPRHAPLVCACTCRYTCTLYMIYHIGMLCSCSGSSRGRCRRPLFARRAPKWVPWQ